jgi:hypothetical protein
MFASTPTPLFAWHGGFRNFAGWTLEVMVGFFIAVAIMFVFYKTVRWLCCWRNFKRFLFGLACFVTLIALFYAEEDWRGWHAWSQFKHAWKAKGERFDMASVVPSPVPDDQNFAMSPVWVAEEKYLFQKNPEKAQAWYGDRIFSEEVSNIFLQLPVEVMRSDDWSLKIEGNWDAGKKTDLKTWQAYYRNPAKIDSAREFPIAPQPQSPAADVLLALSKYDPVIEKLRADSALPYSRFPLEYNKDDPDAILLPHLAAVKRYAQVLQLRAIAELENGQSDEALADVKLMLRLTDSIRTEPDLIAHFVRIAIVNITLQPIYEGLAEHRWSDAQLIALDAELAKLDFQADHEFCQRGELGFSPKESEYRRRTRDPEFFYYNEFGNNQIHPLDVELAVFMYRHCPSGWFYQNQLRYCRFAIQNFLPAMDASRQLAFPASASRANAALQKEVAHSNPYNFLERKIVLRFNGELSPDRLVEKFAYGQESVDMARVACALERYRLAHGEYPESLDALAPQFIAKLPHDIINGQPLHYRRTSDGQFVLYSVGWNETDDGGVVGLKENGSIDINTGDWVWRYPSK